MIEVTDVDSSCVMKADSVVEYFADWQSLLRLDPALLSKDHARDIPEGISGHS